MLWTPPALAALGSLPAAPLLAAVLNATAVTIEEQRKLLDDYAAASSAVERTITARRKHRRARRGGGGRGGASGADGTTASPSRLLLVLGVISNPRTPHTRDWIRSTYMSTAPHGRRAGKVVLRFVAGQRGLTDNDRRQLRAEHAKYADIEYIDASDFGERGGIFSCIDKLFAWFPHAVAAFPNSRFYAKADDDSYVDVRRLLKLLIPLSPLRNAYMGYVQYDSFITDEWKHCGWAAGPVGAAHAYRHGACPRDWRSGAGGGVPAELFAEATDRSRPRSFGPFPFVVGALTMVSADLASWMRDSPMLHGVVAAGRRSQAERVKHWDCGYSDVTLGYALARSNLSISLVSVRDAMRDATYGAMQGSRFVVSHHLRTKAQFDKTHAEARDAAEWRPRLEPCVPWNQIASRPLPGSAAARAAEKRKQRGGGAGGSAGPIDERERRELGDALAAFPGCQTWQLCEVAPGEVEVEQPR